MVNNQEALSRQLSGSSDAANSSGNWRIAIHLGADELKCLDAITVVSKTIGKIYTTADVHFSPLCVILNELLNNALDHGILRLDSSIKQGSDGFEDYLHQREHALQTLTAGSIDFEIENVMTDGRCGVKIHIVDSGNGFDYSALQNTSLEKAVLGQHGRGIALVKRMAHKLIFSGKGNEATAYYVCE
jgi:two-component sensor histidine kinase